MIMSLLRRRKQIQSSNDGNLSLNGVSRGTMLSWGEAKARIRQNIDMETFEKICEPCSCKASGLYRKALTELTK